MLRGMETGGVLRRGEGWNGEVARLTLAAPPANLVDFALMDALESACRELAGRRTLKAIVLDAEGPHFSYGASVAEHLPGTIERALPRFSRLLAAMLELPAPTVAAVRGRCLGGGLELALACDLVLAESGALLGLPEIRLGVFPPAAAALLPRRIGSGPAADWILTGRSWTAGEARAFGVVNRLAEPGRLEPALDALIRREFLPRSAAGLRHACRASRRGAREALERDLPALERQYLEELMREPDAAEGPRAFLEKRAPRWSAREQEGE